MCSWSDSCHSLRAWLRFIPLVEIALWFRILHTCRLFVNP